MHGSLHEDKIIRSILFWKRGETVSRTNYYTSRLNNQTIQLEKPLKNGEERMTVRLKKNTKKTTKLYAPEEYILELAEKDLEELY